MVINVLRKDNTEEELTTPSIPVKFVCQFLKLQTGSTPRKHTAVTPRERPLFVFQLLSFRALLTSNLPIVEKVYLDKREVAKFCNYSFFFF